MFQIVATLSYVGVQDSGRASGRFLELFVEGVLASAFHQAYETEEETNRTRSGFLWFFLSGRDERSCVVFQFLVTMRTRVCIHEIAKFNPAVRAF